MSPSGNIRTADTVAPGGNLDIEVSSGATEITLVVPGEGIVVVPVTRGRAEYQLPPTVPGGAVITISDNKPPSPSTATVDVIAPLP